MNKKIRFYMKINHCDVQYKNFLNKTYESENYASHTASILDGFLQAFTKYDCLVGSPTFSRKPQSMETF